MGITITYSYRHCSMAYDDSWSTCRVSVHDAACTCSTHCISSVLPCIALQEVHTHHHQRMLYTIYTHILNIGMLYLTSFLCKWLYIHPQLNACIDKYMLLHHQSTYSTLHVCHPVYSGYRRPHLPHHSLLQSSTANLCWLTSSEGAWLGVCVWHATGTTCKRMNKK